MNKRLYLLRRELGIKENDKDVPNINNIIKKVNNAIDAEPAERKIYMKKRFFSLAIAAALILTITGVTVMAATLNWNQKFVEYFNPTQQQMEQLTGAVNIPAASDSNNGYTVNVLQTITDKHGIYVLYELIAPEGMKLDEKIHWDRNYFDVKFTDESGKNINAGMEMFKVLEVNGNKMTFMQYAEEKGKIVNDQNLSLKLEDLLIYDVSRDETTEKLFAECEFDLNWKLSYQDSTKTFDINKKVNMSEDMDTTLRKIEISPMSLWIFIEGDEASVTKIKNKPVINYKDGRKLDFIGNDDKNSDISYDSDNEDGLLTLSYKFGRITDISEIESITIGDVTVPVSE